MVEAVSDGYGTLGLDFYATWRRVLAGDRVRLSVQASGTEYASGLLGLDGNLLAEGVWQRILTPRTSVQVEALGWAFRRENMDDFNLNAWRGSARLSWRARSNLLASAGGRYQRIGFTDRFVSPDTTLISGPGDVIVFPVGTDTETDHQTDALLNALWRHRRVSVSVEGAYRWARSNEPLVEYDGPQVSVRVGSQWRAGNVVGYLTAARRDFRERYLLEDEEARRRDRALQLGLYADRAVGGGVRLYVDGAWLRQDSELEQFTFEQFQIQAGLRVSLLEPASGLQAVLELGPPPAGEGPVVFRYRAPEAAAVAVVGDFNGWDPEAHPLERRGDGVWERALALEPGIYRYAYVVDGKWVKPPEAARYEADGFGGQNGVLIVQ